MNHKSPVLHVVRAHKREGKLVHQHQRGHGVKAGKTRSYSPPITKLTHVDAVLLAAEHGIYQKNLEDSLDERLTEIVEQSRRTLGLSTEKYLNGREISDHLIEVTNLWQGEPNVGDFEERVTNAFIFPGAGTDWDAMKKAMSKGLLSREKVGKLYFIKPTLEGKNKIAKLKVAIGTLSKTYLKPLTDEDKRKAQMISKIRNQAWYDSQVRRNPASKKELDAKIKKWKKELDIE